MMMVVVVLLLFSLLLFLLLMMMMTTMMMMMMMMMISSLSFVSIFQFAPIVINNFIQAKAITLNKCHTNDGVDC